MTLVSLIEIQKFDEISRCEFTEDFDFSFGQSFTLIPYSAHRISKTEDGAIGTQLCLLIIALVRLKIYYATVIMIRRTKKTPVINLQ